MQAARGGGRPRRERPGRRRPGAAEAAAAPAGSGADGPGRGGGGGRGRGGARGHRGGGGGRGRREARGRGAAPHARRVEDDDDDESREEEEKEDVKSYSRRKIVSNWSRYEDAEREGQNDDAETQRGTDFHVLLSSAGDSFTQFRFAEEKEWETESISYKQLSALNIDCQSLVQALQDLPLHVRLNVAAELVQASTPVELPHLKFKNLEDGKRRETLFQQSLAQSKAAPVPRRGGSYALPSQPKDARAAEPRQRGRPPSEQETDHLDEELDRLLSLDAPVTVENKWASSAIDSNIAEEDQKVDYKEKEPQKLEVPEEKSSASEQQQQQQSISKNVTEEELEDWLDSMIS